MSSDLDGTIYVGAVFGRLKATEKVGIRRWKFTCTCGNVVEEHNSSVLTGKVKSCGCLLREMRIAGTSGQGNRSHGMSRSPLMKIWRQMHDRATNVKQRGYATVGGRGIRVDPRWATFEQFLADVGERPEGARLERKDVTKNYGPDNFHWVKR